MIGKLTHNHCALCTSSILSTVPPCQALPARDGCHVKQIHGLDTVASCGFAVGSLQFLQGLLGCICIMFGVLWFRAVERVRASVIERTSVARFVSQVMTCLCTKAKETMLARLVVFQAAVRRQQAIRLRWRLEAMEAYVTVVVAS